MKLWRLPRWPPIPLRAARWAVVAAHVVALLAACGDDGGDAAPLSSRLAGAGVDVTALFAPPTSDELAAVEEAWRARALDPRDVLEERRVERPDGSEVRVVSHRSTGGRHYGGLVIPAEGVDGETRLPVALALSGFGPPFTVALDDQRPILDRFVTVVPAFRGQRLVLGDAEWVSDGPRFDQCDGGTDDALALLAVALAELPMADPERVVVLGGSRGGNVALLAAYRDARLRRAVSLAGPTDYLVASYVDHPNLGVLYEEGFLRGLLDGRDDETAARRAMIACSPVHFADGLPPTQLHHGTEDWNVPVETVDRLATRWRALGRDPTDLEVHLYEGDDHQLVASRPLVAERVERFFAPFLP